MGFQYQKLGIYILSGNLFNFGCKSVTDTLKCWFIQYLAGQIIILEL